MAPMITFDIIPDHIGRANLVIFNYKMLSIHMQLEVYFLLFGKGVPSSPYWPFALVIPSLVLKPLLAVTLAPSKGISVFNLCIKDSNGTIYWGTTSASSGDSGLDWDTIALVLLYYPGAYSR